MIETSQNSIAPVEANANFESRNCELPLLKKETGDISKRRYEVSTLQDLISKLYKEFDKDVVDVDYISEIMSSYKSAPHEWKKYAKFDRYR